ncbi:hypothetical protein BDF19DRAFT_431207 [Syncephalis fuscata]|nr:hypothetical protein BDF19DRAFT_431207 [Syncephalis fuscata]
MSIHTTPIQSNIDPLSTESLPVTTIQHHQLPPPPQLQHHHNHHHHSIHNKKRNSLFSIKSLVHASMNAIGDLSVKSALVFSDAVNWHPSNYFSNSPDAMAAYRFEQRHHLTEDPSGLLINNSTDDYYDDEDSTHTNSRSNNTNKDGDLLYDMIWVDLCDPRHYFIHLLFGNGPLHLVISKIQCKKKRRKEEKERQQYSSIKERPWHNIDDTTDIYYTHRSSNNRDSRSSTPSNDAVWSAQRQEEAMSMWDDEHTGTSSKVCIDTTHHTTTETTTTTTTTGQHYKTRPLRRTASGSYREVLLDGLEDPIAFVERPTRGTTADPNYRLLLTLWHALYRHARFLSYRDDILSFSHGTTNSNHCSPLSDDLFLSTSSSFDMATYERGNNSTITTTGPRSNGHSRSVFDRLWPAEFD